MEEMCDDSATEAHIRLMLRMLVKFYDIIETGALFLEEQKRREIKAATWVVCSEYTALAASAHEAKKLMWSIVPKLHFCYHIALQAEYINPAAVWTYSFESFVGIISDVAQACSIGQSILKVSDSLLDRWRIGFHLSLTRLLN